ELDGEVVVGPGRFEQAEAVGGGAPDGGQVGVVGLVAGIGGVAVLVWREGVDQAGVGGRPAGGGVAGAGGVCGAVGGGGEGVQVVLLHGAADAVASGLEVATAMRQSRGFEEDTAEEVGEKVAGAVLGTVDGDDAEVIGSGGLDAGREQASGFLQDEALAGPA